ncbi:MAG: protease [Saprospiraceae bacterium]|nr:MAG: protease [Saprospiraceae bacterium]
MSGSLQIAKLFGIPVKIHWTFLLVFVWIGYVTYGKNGNLNLPVVLAVGFSLLALFTCVVLHELGHALTARRFGVDTRNILLLPIGGLAVLDRLPEKPAQEFYVAIAGPLVNIGLAAVFAPFLLLLPNHHLKEITAYLLNPDGNSFFYSDISFWSFFLVGLVAINFAVALMNLFPAFPMDGGRVLRALLAIRLSRVRATYITTIIAQVSATALFFYGINFNNWLIVIISIFIFFSAFNELRAVRSNHRLAKGSVREAMRTRFTKLYQKDALNMAVNQMQSGLEKHFLVFDEWQTLKGILLKKDLLKAAKQAENSSIIPIDNYVHQKYVHLLPEDNLKQAVEKMYTSNCWLLPVVEKQKVIGVLDFAGVNHYLETHQ